jgi:hypothetical protein
MSLEEKKRLALFYYFQQVVRENNNWIVSFRFVEDLYTFCGNLSSSCNKTKHRKSCEKLPWELVGCQGVKVFLLKDVIIPTSVTTVIFITITIWVFELSQFNFFLVLHNFSFWVWSQFDLSNFVTHFFSFFYNSSFLVLSHF